MTIDAVHIQSFSQHFGQDESCTIDIFCFLKSGRWLSSLVYADDVVLLS